MVSVTVPDTRRKSDSQNTLTTYPWGVVEMRDGVSGRWRYVEQIRRTHSKQLVTEAMDGVSVADGETLDRFTEHTYNYLGMQAGWYQLDKWRDVKQFTEHTANTWG